MIKLSNRYILILIVMAQFCCTSVWFATNAIMTDLIESFKLLPSAVGQLTSAIQFGFITGTLLFAFLTIADRFSPSKVFFISASFAAFLNLAVSWSANSIESLLIWRFLTGIALAGIYPVGMKIAADYFDKGLGKSLGLLVGALLLGTAFPHLLQAMGGDFHWQSIIYATSFLSIAGGVLILVFVPNGPYRKKGQTFKIDALLQVFKPKAFRVAAFGYFGHMWELYTFWAFVPLLLISHQQYHHYSTIHISLISFFTIAIGSLGCIVAGYLADRFTQRKIAFGALSVSGICCLLSPLVFLQSNEIIFIVFLLIWGIAVVADSPLFSTLVAQNAMPELKGSALTIVNCIGFAITIVSIQLVSWLNLHFELHNLMMILAIGPLFGLVYKYVKVSF